MIGVSQPVGTVYTISILTANHVANEGITTANFGLAGDVLQMKLTGKSVTYSLNDPNNTQKLPEDLTIVQATVDTTALVGNANKAAEFALVRANVPSVAAFAVAPPASNPHGTDVPDLTIKAATQSFTEYGYGNQGTYDPTAPAHFTNGAAGTRMFENNVTSALIGANDSIDTGYFQPYGIFTAKSPSLVAGVAPANPTSNGQGTSTTGDSGGPLMFGTAGPTVTVTPNWGTAQQKVPTDIQLSFTNSLAAVVQSVNLTSMNPGVVNVGNQNLVVPLVGGAGGSLAWAQTYANNPNLVPEPGSFILAGLGLAGLGLFARRKKYRKV
ncbi:MAG TPA: PEP-CTERM sorting domain-containing protein [Pirellulales bacterium]|nr:PEP-CTERM sorting domain-containing protein [Pirellulales bacterium]